MATPPQVEELIEALAEDIHVFYVAVAGANAMEVPGAAVKDTARLLARHLVRQGWRRVGGDDLPKCPKGVPICFDPEPHDICAGAT